MVSPFLRRRCGHLHRRRFVSTCTSAKKPGELGQTVDDVIYTSKFEGAAAGLLNSNLISRELGLTDRQEFTGKDGRAIRTIDVSNIEIAPRVAFILADAMNTQNLIDTPTKD
ncbi:hypothetical protein SAMN04488523_10749 [Sulfitobacter brevis]|uniref:Uncharacterized protein n=1 Tax=Sulfitobacter brevis TaxID=74348 RepID=A0A1I2ACZ4_9RHOB|nr:hypothetical protein [Sulfitobacter brevis]SFE41875.1 hypothetical protein SAMN04488523_10749 [Sulfitobacter brevis]